jgi:hypothetical protein
MAIGWFLCPYIRLAEPSRAIRYCAMDDFTSVIRADGGDWREVEVLGNQAVVKVRALAPTLTTLAGTPGFRRIPLNLLNDSLSTLTAGQRTAIRDELLAAGYTLAEVQAALPDLSTVTLRDVLRFLASRRLKPRYDQGTDNIVLDGPVQACGDIDALDASVSL